jgi:4-hydroxybenzoate polyprenyltransferase
MNETANTLRYLFISARPKDWVKNLFVLAPLFFSLSLLKYDLAAKAALAFILFCLLSSGVYLLNDIFDRQEDQKHPQKRHRPIVSGQLKVSTAAICAVVMLLLSIGLSSFVDFGLRLMALAYLLLNLLYSGFLKKVVILDVFCLAAGFVLRVVAGALVIDVEMSRWLIICTVLLSLFLGFSKRRHELVLLGTEAADHRPVLGHYNMLFLDIAIGIVTAATVISYTLYTISAETIAKFGSDRLMLTIPFVLYGVFRYLYLVYRKAEGGNPSHSLLTDLPLMASVVAWALVAGVILYLGRAW